MKTVRWLVVCTLFIGMVALPVRAPGLVLSEVRIDTEGQAPLDESFVRAFTTLRAGEEVGSEEELNAAVARDVDHLRRSGRFSYVRAIVEQDGDAVRLVYQVQARVRLSRIEISGADNIGNRKIRQQLGLKPGDYVDEALVGEKARLVEAFCRKNKYPEAEVSWELKPDPQAGTAELLLKVDEGPQVRVRRIELEGSRFLDDGRGARTARFFKRLVPQLVASKREPVAQFEKREPRRVLSQKAMWWPLPLGGIYRPEQTEGDLAALRTFYRDHGFLDVTVEAPSARSVGKGRMVLTYQVNEGRQYRIGQIDFEGATLFDTQELERQAGLQPGEVASQARINEAAAAVNRYFGNRGYIQNMVQPVILPDPQTGLADIVFSVREGRPAAIREVQIRGNEKTRDEVMRRELVVYPGESFHQQRLETSENRLRNLGFFETVMSVQEPTDDPGVIDLAFLVKEKQMGNFLIGAGFSSVDNLVGFAEVSHGNFDIRRWPPVGDGQKMRARVQAGSKRNDAELSFIEPWFMNRQLALGTDLYHRNARYYSDDYRLQTTGGRLSLTKPLDAFLRATVYYSLEQFRVHDVSAPVGSSIWREEGSRLKSAVGLDFSRDTRDRFYNPTRGNSSSAGVQFAGGPLAGDTDIYRLDARSSHFWPLPGGHVFNLKGAATTVDAYGSARVPIFDRLFLGGPNNLRAFAYRDVSPRDPLNNNEPDGGRSSWFATAEYIVPLWEKVRGAVFYDIGAVSEDAFGFFGADINSGFGIGIRLDLPMFPLRLDYAWPHITDSNNDGAGGRWSFMLGYSF